jgi:hypothetical protein
VPLVVFTVAEMRPKVAGVTMLVPGTAKFARLSAF